YHHFRLVSSLSPTQNVVETFGVPLLKTKDIPASDLSNCEGSARERAKANKLRMLNMEVDLL
ncbi:MAG: hypothetical protein ACLPX8_14310, partial [Bryobacteraceae bacterium]